MKKSDRTIGNAASAVEEVMKKLMKIVNEQAEDEGLWFIAETAPEAYLQQELRRLHKAIEENLFVITAINRLINKGYAGSCRLA